MSNPGQSRPERRLAAILAADIAGYSRLMSDDEAGTAHALLEHRAAIAPIVASHGGRIVKTTGDSVLLDFSSVVAAVECAAAIQKVMSERNAALPPHRQMLFRIGVNVGDVLVEGDDILGDGVNIAARLEGIAEPGGICISDDAYRQVQGKISAQFVDGGEQQLKNISRPVRVYRVFPQGAAGARPALALPDKPSIAILPFDNMSEVSEDIYFADGIAEDIITELSRYPDLFVVARNSSFTYRGRAARVTEIARELGVRYVLEGSVRRAGKRIRISAQLIDAGSGKHLWAQRYDRDLADLFAIQDEVTQSIVAVLPERVQAAAFDRASRKTSNSLDAYDHLLRGKYYHHLETAADNREAESHFDRSIELDPLFASAYAWKACTLGQALGSEFRPRTPENHQQIVQLLERATSIDANDTECHRIMSRIALMQGKYAKSEYHLERALALNPNDPRLVVQRGINLTFLGSPKPLFRGSSGQCGSTRSPPTVIASTWCARCSWPSVPMRRQPSSNGRCGAIGSTTFGSRHAMRLRATGRRPIKPDNKPWRCGRTCRSPPIAAYADGRFKWKHAEDKARFCDALAQAGLPS